MKAKTVGIGAAVVVGLAIVGSSMSGGDTPVVDTTTTVVETTIVEQTTTTEQAFSEADLEIMALDITLDLDELCPLLNDLIAGGLPQDETISFAVDQFEDGFGGRLEPEAREHLASKLRGC